TVNLPNSAYLWCRGIIDVNNDSAQPNWDMETTIKQGVIWPYCKSPDIFRCPADTSRAINPQNQKVPRVRSMSMSNWVGGNGDSPTSQWRGFWGLGGKWHVYRRISEMRNPGPSSTWVLLDERLDSINDAYFVTEMDEYGIPSTYKLID